MTLTLPPETEARLHSVAAQRGLPPEKTLDVLLVEADTNYYEAIAGIQRGMDDYTAGRWISLEDYEAEAEAKQNKLTAQSVISGDL